MPICMSRRDGCVTLALEGELTIYMAAEFKARLEDALAESSRLKVDLAGVCELDAAGLQLLIAAKRAAEANAGSLRLAGCGDAVRNVFDLCNVNEYFGGPAGDAAPALDGPVA